MKYTKEQKLAVFRKLPEDVGNLFLAPETSEAVWGISKKHNLTEKQESELFDVESNLILQLDPIEDLITNLTTSLGIDTGKAVAIKDDLYALVIRKFEALGMNFAGKQNATPTKAEPLPSTLVSRENVEKSVYEISKKFGLSDEQKNKLSTQINNVLEGKTYISAFRANLVQELDFTYDQALKISLDTNIGVFGPVIEKLKSIEASKNGTDSIKTVADNKEVSAQPAPTKKPTPAPEFTKDGQRNGPEAHPEHILMDHEQMEKMDGMHLHSQSVMPTKTSASMSPPQRTHRIFSHTPKPTPPPAPAPFNPTHSVSPSNLPTSTPTSAPSQPQTPPKPSFRSIVDEKLSSLVRTTNETARPSEPITSSVPTAPIKPKGYAGNDPYREPIE